LFEPDLVTNGIGLRSRLIDPLLAGEPLITRIAEGISACKSIGKTVAVVQPRDTAEVSEWLEGSGCRIIAAEVPDVPHRQLMRRARKWALNCWSGGLGDTYVFAEEGNPAAMVAAAIEESADIVVKFSAMSPFVDREMVDAMVAEFIGKKGNTQFLYSAAPPGFSYEVYSARFLQLLSETGQTLQDVLQLKPAVSRAPVPDPTVTQSFFMVPIELSSSNYRFMADSRRGVELVTALIDLEGTGLLGSPCSDVVSLLRSRPDLAAGAAPREIEIEMKMKACEELLREAADYDDTRATFHGGRDALCSAEFAGLLAFARKAGIFGLHVHTDGIGLTPEWLDSCVAADVDVISVSFPIDGADPGACAGAGNEGNAAENKSALAAQMMLDRLRELGRPTPFILPEMVVTKTNWQAQERFFDAWFSKTGHVVLRSHDDLAGQIEDESVMHLLPGRRRICERILNTMFVQADGRVPLCHVDARRGGSIGHVGESRIAAIWQGKALAALRESHLGGDFAAFPLCEKCRSWG
jgi:hypothetical protein